MEKDLKEKVESAKETAAKVSDAAKETAVKVSDTAKEKAKQAQEYLQSEEFQNKKNEAVKNTKSAANKFFKCTINNDEDYARAGKRRKGCIYAIIAAVAATIILFPFYDKHFWLDGGLIKLILHILSVLSVISKVLVVPVSIILLVRYFFANKAVKEYSTANPNVQPDKLNTKKAISILVASVILCAVFTPVLNKIDDSAYSKWQTEHYSSNSDSWAAGQTIDPKDNPELYGNIMKAFNNKTYSNGQTFGEVLFNEMLVPGGAGISIKTGNKADTYNVKVSGNFKISDVGTISQDLTFKVTEENGEFHYVSVGSETIHFVDVLVPQYLGL